MIIMHQRDKCIGCNSCVENSPRRWKMSEEDGKADLIGGKRKGEFFVLETDDSDKESDSKAADDCPVRIIHIK
jgi:ferredoxin